MIDLTTLSMKDLENILSKMRFYDVSDGYLSKEKGKIVLFLQPCIKATQLVTDNEVFDAIKTLNLVQQQ